jgi:F-type H+-transporting ATPase subunit b
MHFFDESFWLAVSFIIFIYFAYKPVKRAILNSLDAKVAEVKAHVLEAENLKQDAAALLLKTQIEIKNLDNLRNSILNTARSDAKMIAQTRAIEMDELLERKKQDAIDSINQQQIKAYNNIKQDFASLTTKLVKEYLKESSNNNSSDIEIAKHFIKK